MMRRGITKLDEGVRAMRATHVGILIVISSIGLGASMNIARHFWPTLPGSQAFAAVPSDSVRAAFRVVESNTVRIGTTEQRVLQLEEKVDSSLLILRWQQCVTRAQMASTSPYDCAVGK